MSIRARTVSADETLGAQVAADLVGGSTVAQLPQLRPELALLRGDAAGRP